MFRLGHCRIETSMPLGRLIAFPTRLSLQQLTDITWMQLAKAKIPLEYPENNIEERQRDANDGIVCR